MITTLILISALALANNDSAPPERINLVKAKMIDRGMTQADIERFFSDSRLEVYPPAKGEINWLEFRRAVMSAESIERGLDFHRRYFDIFKEAESMFDVRSTLIASIIRIESNFGGYLGKEERNAFSHLYSRLRTNAQSRHGRPKWISAANELAALAYYCFITKTDCFTLRSSHAGAIGLPQFMPSNILKRGHNGRHQDPTVDLFRPEHAIPSAANFLKYELNWNETKPWTAKKKILAAYYGDGGHYPEIAMEYIMALEARVGDGNSRPIIAKSTPKRSKTLPSRKRN